MEQAMLGNSARINDDMVIGYISFLQSLETPLTNINIEIEVERENSEITNLLYEIAKKRLNVRSLRYHYAFRNPSSCSSASSQASIHPLKEIMKKCSVKSYVGAYVEGMRLPSGDDWPNLSVATSADYRSLTEELHKNKGRLSDLSLCVSSEIAASDLKEPIPFEGRIRLFLPDASDIAETSNTIKALMPPTGKFRWLYFPRCGMKSSSGEMERLLQNLLHLRVKVSHAVVFPSPEEPEEGSAEGEKLQNLARQLGASRGIYWRDEEHMWI